jgi:hypothetical protein
VEGKARTMSGNRRTSDTPVVGSQSTPPPHKTRLRLIKRKSSIHSKVGNFVDERNLSDLALSPLDHMIEVKDLQDSLCEFEEHSSRGAECLFDQY